VAKRLNELGVSAAAVTEKTHPREREQVLADFKSGKLRAVANVSVLTTGFNHPGVDLIAMLRPTLSRVLFIQMVGRGSRPADDKINCLVLDFAYNTERHGLVNDGEWVDLTIDEKGPPKPRICPKCDHYSPPHADKCRNPDCGYVFPKEVKPRPINHRATAGTTELIQQNAGSLGELIDRLSASPHARTHGGENDHLRIHFTIAKRSRGVIEFVNMRGGTLSVDAQYWWSALIGADTPMPSIHPYWCHEIAKAKIKRVWVRMNSKNWPEIWKVLVVTKTGHYQVAVKSGKYMSVVCAGSVDEVKRYLGWDK
jgi:ribosomal protein L40E